jgi:hypothetical protein
MTLNKFIKELLKLQKHHGRSVVAVDKPTFWDGNGTFNACEVKSVDAISVNVSDGDGFTKTDRRGRECTRVNVLISGEPKRMPAPAPEKGK